MSASLAHWLRGLKPDALTSPSARRPLPTRRASPPLTRSAPSFSGCYILIDRDRLRGGLFAVVPRSHHVRLSRVLMNLETIVGRYIRGQVLTSVLMSVFTFVF